ncbi:hypothetical protein GCM10010468_21730 [Actinocorallia longicatena]|uniref:non-specific serine/threonine protein kinase n=1 Tax=Actinocorallia longicatena TaxID=111803 RepID=A0ABP6Q673_9ACTN
MLGTGAQGRVVLARDTGGREVAVKYLSALDERGLELFRREAELLSLLDDPHVVRLERVVEDEGRAALVLEYVQGVTLRRVLDGRAQGLGPVGALTVLKGSLLGLGAAHAAGVTHRDYKPANVMVPPTGEGKLIDFGVAAWTGAAGRVGTPAYMSPEQWRREPAGPAADVYAATCVFFECLTGRTPFGGDESAHLSAEPPLDDVPEELRPLIVAGLAKDPAERPGDAAAFVGELETLAASAYGGAWEDRGIAALAVFSAAAPMASLLAAGGGAGGAALAPAATTQLASTAVKTGVLAKIGGTGVAIVAGASVLVAGTAGVYVARDDAPRKPAVRTAPAAVQVALAPESTEYPEIGFREDAVEIVRVSGLPDPAVQERVNQALRSPVDEALAFWRAAFEDERSREVRNNWLTTLAEDRPLRMKARIASRGPRIVSVMYDLTTPAILQLGAVSSLYRSVNVDLATGRLLDQETFFPTSGVAELSRRVPAPGKLRGPRDEPFLGWETLEHQGLARKPLLEAGLQLAFTPAELLIGWHSNQGAEGAEQTKKLVTVPLDRVADLLSPGVLALVTGTAPAAGGTAATPPPPTARLRVTTFGEAPVRERPAPGARRLASYKAGRHDVLCKVEGPEVRVGEAHNHWWLRTTTEDGAEGYFSAYFLKDHGDDEAYADGGVPIPAC